MLIAQTTIIGIVICSIAKFLLGSYRTRHGTSLAVITNMLYWGLPAIIVLIINGARKDAAFMVGFALYFGAFIPPTQANQFSHTSDMFTDLWTLLVRSLMTLWPASVIAWVYGLYWPFITWFSVIIPLIYLLSAMISEKHSRKIADIMLGTLLALSLEAAVQFAYWGAWPPVPQEIRALYL